MATDPAANLQFLPWARQGAAATIHTPDTLGPNMPGVVQLAAAIQVNAAAPTGTPVRLRGPADVIGIDPAQIVRMEPQPGSADFEPNYFPSIEFDRADFPWLFTPASPGASAKLRPWLCLIVVRKQDGIVLGSAPGSPLATLSIGVPASPAVELPDLSESWAWAHAQTSGDVSDAASVGAALNGAPSLALSRLVCPRVLAPGTDYVACVVPTFELGRKAGLGMALSDADLVAASALAPAWSMTAALAEVLLPIYCRWEFRTGQGGDFRSLVEKLTARPAPAGFGLRPIDISQPGFVLPAGFPAGTTLGLEGALQALTAPATLPAWPQGTDTTFQPALAAIVNAPGKAAAVDPASDPLLAPPLYGQWYAARATVNVGSPAWFDTLNLDPRLRSVAGFGTRVVQEHQEALMASAWEQAAEIRRANQRVRQLQLSVAVGASLYGRHFAPLSSDAMLRIAAPAFGRIRSTAQGESVPRTLLARVVNSAVPLRATSSAMRVIGRVQGPLTRRAASQGIARSAAATWLGRLNGSVGAIFIHFPVYQQATIAAVINTMSGASKPRAYSAVTSAAVAAEARRPNFQIAAVGQPVVVPPLVPGSQTQDNATAAAFRSAAIEHLQRIAPARGAIVSAPPIALVVDTVRTIVLTQMAPQTSLVALTRAVLATKGGTSAAAGSTGNSPVGVDVVQTNPVFVQPMYEPLRDLSQDLLLPGLNSVPPDTVLGLKTNVRFVESYMVGLNVEMGHELLWRGFPTDQRGTYFNQFWDRAAAEGSAATATDIKDIKGWGEKSLGDPQIGVSAEQFVMFLRSALLRRYPNAIIYATPALATNGVRAPSRAVADEKPPIFRGSVPSDITFFGFDLSTARATGTDGSAGYYIVIQEHPTEPRFGLKVGIDNGGKSHIALGAGPPQGVDPGALGWGRNSATMAGILRRRPVRVAIHASQFIALA
jgi:hypothetical protein